MSFQCSFTYKSHPSSLHPFPKGIPSTDHLILHETNHNLFSVAILEPNFKAQTELKGHMEREKNVITDTINTQRERERLQQ